MKRNKIVIASEILKEPCKPCKSVEKGLVIGEELLQILADTGNGVGLAANQIGLSQRVCVINVTQPIILINPEITGKFEKIYFQEACLSFPGDYVITKRYANIAVKADNHSDVLLFGPKNILECVCVQHEIDHLDGLTMHDRRAKGVE
jgi:peptide deformylase